MCLEISHFNLVKIKTYLDVIMSGRGYIRRSSSPIRIQVVIK